MLSIIPQPQSVREGDAAIYPDFSKWYLFSPHGQNEQCLKRLKKGFPTSDIHLVEDEGFCLSTAEDRSLLASVRKEGIRGKHDGYILTVQGEDALVYADTPQGLFYGIITLSKIKDSVTRELYIEDYADVESRYGYYDLRMIYPKFELLLAYIEDMATYKANGVVIEYEDKRPFSTFPFLAHPEYGMTEEQLATLLAVAKDNFVEIIPLQQTFGHLEYVLKHAPFKGLREDASSIGELCPSNPASFDMVKGLLEDIIRLHPDSRYIHVGGDEVWTLCSCPACRERYGEDKERCFIDFLNRIIETVCAHGKTPIVWHDMLEHCREENLARLDKRAVIMLWIYSSKPITDVVKGLCDKFRAFGLAVMGASAVRNNGGKDDQNYPIVDSRMKNVEYWVEPMRENGISAIVSTNWAASFGMACPYGIYETAFYTLYFSFDKYWNGNADKGTYLPRFLADFHGVDLADPAVQAAIGYRRYTDYYYAIGALAPKCTKNANVAEWIRTVQRYEQAKTHFPPNLYAYRYALYGEEEGELTSLKSKINAFNEKIEDIRPKMLSLLREFMTDSMANVYMASRFFIIDYLNEHLYNEILKK